MESDIDIMSYEQKLAALNALAECKILMRKPGDWYVDQAVEVKSRGSSILRGEFGNGNSPQTAIEDHWRVLVSDLPVTDFLVIRAVIPDRREIRWNGFMWEDHHG